MQVLEKYFDTAFDAPDGIKKLRELILTLAMQGKLVPQDQNDQPASELLKEIEKEKQVTSTTNKKKISVIKSNKEPYSISKSWEWVKLEDVSIKVHYGYTASANFHIKTPKLLRITDIQDNKVEWENVPGGDIEANKINQYLLSNNDILIARTGGTIGKSYLIENINLDAIFASYLIRVVPSKHINPKFLKLFIESPLYWKQLYLASSGTGQPNVNGTSLCQLDLPLPPLNEQKRIVEKINQLMALCDELEKLKEQKEAKKLTVHKSAINQLLDSKNENNSQKGWNFISEHFNDLYTIKENVSELRNTILQLAMQGKLVPQDQNDQPASKLLKEVEKKKQQLIKDGRIKKSKPLGKIKESEMPYDIPASWEWVKFGNIGLIGSSSRVHQQDWLSDGIPFYRAREIVKLAKQGYVDNELFISEAMYNNFKSKGLTPETKDIMITGVGTIGIPYVVKEDDKFYFKDASVLIFKNYFNLNERFLRNFCLSPYWINTIHMESMGTTVHTLTINRVNDVLIPLPPLNEQDRIVEKINQLMALCDDLEKQIENSSSKQTELLNAIMSNLGK